MTVDEFIALLEPHRGRQVRYSVATDLVPLRFSVFRFQPRLEFDMLGTLRESEQYVLVSPQREMVPYGSA